MKILLVTQYYYPERFSTTDIAEELVRQGNEVTVVTAKPCYGFDKPLKEYKKINFEIINGVKVHRVKVHPRGKGTLSLCQNYYSYYLHACNKVRRIKEDFDIVLTISLSPVISIWPGIRFAKKHHIPCVLYCEDIWPESVVSVGAVKKDTAFYRYLFKASKYIYSNLDKIMVSSPSFKNYFENVLGVSGKGYKFIPQPVIDSNRSSMAVNYKSKHNLVYAGNIGSIQLVSNLVLAMKEVKTEDTVLHLLGNGSELNNVLSLIKEHHLEDKIIYEGSYPMVEAEAFYENADALVVSLKGDDAVGRTIPNKAIQYLKYSKPILGVIKGDGKDFLYNIGGSLFSDEDPTSIAKTVDELLLLSDKEKEKLGNLNKEYFINKLSKEKLVSEMLEEMKTTLNK